MHPFARPSPQDSLKICSSIPLQFLINTLFKVGYSLVWPGPSKTWLYAGDTPPPPCFLCHSFSCFFSVPLVPVTDIPRRRCSKCLSWLLCKSYSRASLSELFLFLLAPTTPQKNLIPRSGRNKDSPSIFPRHKASIALAYLPSCLLSSFCCVQNLTWVHKTGVCPSHGTYPILILVLLHRKKIIKKKKKACFFFLIHKFKQM